MTNGTFVVFPFWFTHSVDASCSDDTRINISFNITKVEVIEEKLIPNEFEMLRNLQAKYVEPLDPAPYELISLNFMLRNVEIRKG